MSDQKSWIKRTWARITALPPIILLVSGLFVGIILWGGFNTTLEMTNTMGFCLSCHEMRNNPYTEYKETIHFKNPSGVQVTCADCHVPRPWVYKVKRKIEATRELYGKATGKIDTDEKFNAHRWEMANRVWDSMKSTDSRECRNCHSFDSMDLSEQDRSARKKHSRAVDADQTCIDCHKGIAHEQPDEPEETDESSS
ncbi:MAG: NapC/NirT family cytochrome c [Gammaproteobacteria bacterium]|nr:NapC/NirT family cytochrome c [Gammaproteobacteria bacterium]